MQNICIYPAINSNIIEALRKKVACMPATAKVCSVVLDEMTIKESVTYNKEMDYVEGMEDFGWCLTIRALLLLWKDLRETQNLQYLFTKRLNQDCIENLFSLTVGPPYCIIDKYADDTALTGQITDDDDSNYRHEIDDFVDWQMIFPGTP
nr:hypothetical protein BaRGS_026078 [Batillaria attramentaria]